MPRARSAILFDICIFAMLPIGLLTKPRRRLSSYLWCRYRKSCLTSADFPNLYYELTDFVLWVTLWHSRPRSREIPKFMLATYSMILTENEPRIPTILRAVACGPGRRSSSVMLGHACETLAVMYLQRLGEGPPTAEIDPSRIESIEPSIR